MTRPDLVPDGGALCEVSHVDHSSTMVVDVVGHSLALLQREILQDFFQRSLNHVIRNMAPCAIFSCLIFSTTECVLKLSLTTATPSEMSLLSVNKVTDKVKTSEISVP